MKRLALFILAVTLTACGSEVSKAPVNSTIEANAGSADAGQEPESACGRFLLESDAGCEAPAREILMIARMQLRSDEETSVAVACVRDVVDPETFRTAVLDRPAVIFSSNQCDVLDPTKFLSTEEVGLETLQVEGGFSVTRDAETVTLTPSFECLATSSEATPADFFEYGGIYRFNSSGTVAPMSQAEVAIPNSPSFELPNMVAGAEYVFEYRPQGAEEVRLSIGDLNDEFIVECTGRDTGTLTIPASVTDFLQPNSRMSANFRATNRTREIIDDVNFLRYGESRVASTIEIR